MPFRSQTILGVQITNDKIRLVEGKRADVAISVSRTETFPHGPGKDLYQTLREALKSSKVEKVCLTLPSNSANHFFFSLPALKKKDALIVVERELAQTASFAVGDSFFDFTIPSSDGDGPLDYAVLSAKKNEVLATISECQRAGKKPILLTSYPFSLQHLLQVVIPEFRDQIYASLHIEEDKGFLSIFKKGTLVFTRSFSLKIKAPMPSDFGSGFQNEISPTATRIIQETSRSLLFYKQHSHGLMAKGIIVSGNIADTGTLETTMQDELGVETHFLSPEDGKGLLTLLKQKDKPLTTQALMEYAVPLGLIHASTEDTPNLIPEIILKKKTIFWGRLAMIIIAIILFGGAAFTHLTLRRQAAILQEAVTTQESIHKRMLPIIAAIKKTKKSRERYQALSQFSKGILASPVFWTPFWEDVSQIIPEEMVIDQAEFVQDTTLKTTYKYKFTGQINSPSAEKAQEVYQKFIDLLFSSPCVIEGTFSPPEILPAKTRVQVQPPAGHDVLGSLKSKVQEIEQKGASLAYHLQGKLQTKCVNGGGK